MRSSRSGAWLLALLLLPLEARAVRPQGDAARDSRRFGARFDRKQRRNPRALSRTAFSDFTRAEGGKWMLRFDPRTGLPSAVVGGKTRRRQGPAAQAAAAFLQDTRVMLGIEPADLVVERESTGPGQRHVLFRQTYRGLPVEFSRVKVHMDDAGAVTGYHSNFEPISGLDTTPLITAAQAGEVVRADLGAPPHGRSSLLVYPSEADGKAHLAWKLVASGRDGRWNYYVDAKTGALLFRYNDLRFAIPCLTSGTVTGLVYDTDPSEGSPVPRPFNHERVYIQDGSTFVETGGFSPVAHPELVTPENTASGFQGAFCGQTTGKIFTQLQGPYVHAASFRGPSAHYDNASGIWSTVATPVSSPHPYPANTVITSTISLASIAPTAVKFLPVFTNFDVGAIQGGAFGEALDFADDDTVEIVDSFGQAVAGYIGARGAFNGAAVPGKLMRLRLVSGPTGVLSGYDVAFSSYLVLPNASQAGYSSFTWNPASHTAIGLRGELDVFYHLNLMHDFFMGGVNKSSAANIANPVAAMTHVGPSLLNAFYDPFLDRLFFGDVNESFPSDAITDDSMVPRHEYTHFVVEKIWPIQNFGQAGAISEANADYFSASSYGGAGRPRFGLYFNTTLGFSGALRELDCAANPPCAVLINEDPINHQTNWKAEIHDDSIFVSQSYWDIRKDLFAADATFGPKCMDGLVFQALLSFPESFQELRDALRRVDAAGTVKECGQGNFCGGCGFACAPGCHGATIDTRLGQHGLPLGTGSIDPFDTVGSRRNDGFETAVDITTLGVVTATIFPAADIDYFTFGAGPGKVSITITLPPDASFFKGYQLTLFDKDRKQVAFGAPPFDGFNTFDGACVEFDCTTSHPTATLEYENTTPGQLFLQVAGGASDSGSNSGVNSTLPYTLRFAWEPRGAVKTGIVNATFDQDRISYNVKVTTFPQQQDAFFAYAQLRDHAQNVIPQTDTRFPIYLTLVSSTNALGQMNGTVRLLPGFADRFPALGTVFLEVFAYNVVGSTFSVGMSNAINLTTNIAEVKAWNNVFSPAKGEKTTIKYDILEPGRLTMRLYSMTGQLVGTLFDADVPAGKGAVDWYGQNSGGSTVASGIYLLHINGPGVSKIRKIAVVK